MTTFYSPPGKDLEMVDPEEIYNALIQTGQSVVVGNSDVIELLFITELSKGHILLDGVSGIGKKTISDFYADATGQSLNHIQLTTATTPTKFLEQLMEGIGTDERNQLPNILYIENLHRAPIRTQNSVIDIMETGVIATTEQIHPFPEPFMVIATHNSLSEDAGTRIPHEHRDAFLLYIPLTPGTFDQEMELLRGSDGNLAGDTPTVDLACSATDIRELTQTVTDVYVDDAVREYLLTLVRTIRNHEAVSFGASPEASIRLQQAIKARSALQGRSYAVPDDVSLLIEPIISGRLELTPEAEVRGLTSPEIINHALESVVPPGTEFQTEDNP